MSAKLGGGPPSRYRATPVALVFSGQAIRLCGRIRVLTQSAGHLPFSGFAGKDQNGGGASSPPFCFMGEFNLEGLMPVTAAVCQHSSSTEQ